MGDNDMSNDVERIFESQDESIQAMLLDNRGDELTDILVQALQEALDILAQEISPRTLH